MNEKEVILLQFNVKDKEVILLQYNVKYKEVILLQFNVKYKEVILLQYNVKDSKAGVRCFWNTVLKLIKTAQNHFFLLFQKLGKYFEIS